MKLKSFGCSFVYGSDLLDCPHKEGATTSPPSHLTWPALLASKFGLEYECHARPAAGNLQILESLLSNIAAVCDMIVIVNWTWIDRFSFTNDASKTGTHSWNPTGWRSILPGDTDPANNFYYRHLHSQFRDKLETLVCIKTAIDTMKQCGIRFIMTYTDELVFETNWHTSAAITYLQQRVRPDLMDFDGLSYWSWVVKNDFEISDKWHPLAQAHAVAADLMTPAIDAILHKA